LVVIAAVLGFSSGLAAANARPPQANGVFFRATHPHSIYVRTTFGLLVSKDDGCSFRWVCERAIGYGGDFDPKYAVAADGTVFATTFDGLRVSRDGGCTWTTATAEQPAGPGKIADLWIDALEISPTGEVWVATAESAGANDVYSSTDNGVTFRSRGLGSPTIWWKSVKVSRTDAKRVYLTGYQVAGRRPDGKPASPVAHLMRSSDGGTTWTELELFGARREPLQFGATPIVLVAAIDPRHSDRLLLTSLGANGKGDRLYRSTDAGYTFAEVLATRDAIKDVLFLADGTVYVASLTGSFRSGDGGATFAPLEGSPQLQCIGQRAGGQLVGCGANWAPDFKAVATSHDRSTWTKLFRFVDLAGPLACAPGTTTFDRCAQAWPALQRQFGATGPGTCPVVADELVAPPRSARSAGGCCEAGDDAPLGAVGFAGWLAFITRRRRHSASRQLG
jgi:hypothetical protein